MPTAPKKPKKPKAKKMSATQRGYDAAHRKFRKQEMAYRVVCECCNRRPSKELHHLVPLRGDRYHENKLDPRNTLCLCKQCHVWLSTSIEPYMPTPVAGKYVIFGRPGSGKSTLALDMANDIHEPTNIWDWDELRPCYETDEQCTNFRLRWVQQERFSEYLSILIVNRCSEAYELGQILAARLIYCPCDENIRQERLRERDAANHYLSNA